MKYETYYKKNGRIYGLSYKPGSANSAYSVKFTDLKEAEDWLNTEEYDFRTRELCSKTRAESMTR